MIIYFSGTGNSEYAAKYLAEENEKIVSLAELMNKNEYTIELADNEKLGLIFPVYFYTLPSIVKEFIEKVEIINAGYVYSVITCGGGTSQASAYLKKILAKKGITLSYFKEVVMPDNSMLFYQIPDSSSAHSVLSKSLKILTSIKSDLKARKKTVIGDYSFVSNAMFNTAYKLCSGTKKFYVQENCIGCGKCERNCPQQVIKIVENRPVWTKDNCCKCSACINRCPVSAIQYGKSTINRNRYVNPLV